MHTYTMCAYMYIYVNKIHNYLYGYTHMSIYKHTFMTRWSKPDNA